MNANMYSLIVVLLCIFGTLKCQDCSASISINGETVVRLLGTNRSRVYPDGIAENNICFDVPSYDLNGCQVATVAHCGINDLSVSTDIVTFNDGGTITFDGIYDVSPADSFDNWSVIIAIDATSDNIVSATGRYEGVTGSRSAIGFVKLNEDGTANFDAFFTLNLSF
eukprot:UN08397